MSVSQWKKTDKPAKKIRNKREKCQKPDFLWLKYDFFGLFFYFYCETEKQSPSETEKNERSGSFLLI